MCFTVLTTRGRDNEMVQDWPQRDSAVLCANVKLGKWCLRDCSDACSFVCACVRVRERAWACVRACVPMGSKGVELPRLQSLGGAPLFLSFFLSLALSPFFFLWSCVVWWFL